MRIMMFSHGYPPTISGVTLVVQKLRRAMVERGHAVMVVTASEKNLPYQSEDQGVQLERILGLPNPFWWEGPMPFIFPGNIRSLADRFKPDIIHTHDNGYSEPRPPKGKVGTVSKTDLILLYVTVFFYSILKTRRSGSPGSTE